MIFKKVSYFLLIIILLFTLTSCNKDDSEKSDNIFTNLKEEFINAEYQVLKISNDRNISASFNITDEDVVSVYWVKNDVKKDFVYIYRFPTEKKATKRFEFIASEVEGTRYSVYKFKHYICVVFGEEDSETVKILMDFSY